MLKDFFYIIYDQKSNWYQLRVKDTHYVLACGSDLTTLLGTVHKYVRKYKNEENILRALGHLTYSTECGEALFEKRQDEYELHNGGDCMKFIRETVEKALEENRQDTPYKRAKDRIKPVVKLAPVENEVKVTSVSRKDSHSCGKMIPRKIKLLTI